MKKILLLGTFLCWSFSSAKADFSTAESYFSQKDYSRAFSEFLPLANEGDFRSQYYIGYLYLNGLGVTQDVKEAVRFLNMSSDQNYDMAQSLLAFLYDEGQAVPQNRERAMELYQRAAEQNNSSANLNLGVMYYNGTIVEKNHAKALEYFKKVPVDEKPIVARYIGDILLNNVQLRNYAQARHYYTLAAKQNELDAFFSLGEIYRRGLGVPKNVATALPYYRYAASKGYAPAQYILGIIYVNGEGGTRNIPKGYAWFSLAAEQRFINAEKALEQLSDTMSVADFDQSRREISMIRENELGKVMPPIVADTTLNQNKPTTNKRNIRRRRSSR